MKILLGVGGGIAAYKAAELARLLLQQGDTQPAHAQPAHTQPAHTQQGHTQQGHQVQVIMTRAAEEFVRPLTFAALTGRKVLTDLFAIESAIEHISVAQDHDLLAIAPATADLMAKLAHGLADDFLTTLYLAFTGPVVIAPAMNVNMWQHAATQANFETLRLRHGRAGPPGGAG
jgi:phosphopantothenoylcysteine decarboxylase/phosphopantothenate--cysteine ligase